MSVSVILNSGFPPSEKEYTPVKLSEICTEFAFFCSFLQLKNKTEISVLTYPFV